MRTRALPIARALTGQRTGSGDGGPRGACRPSVGRGWRMVLLDTREVKGGLKMASTVADYLLERLRAWDVRHVFAYPGDGINAILAAWGRAENEPQFVQARHEEMAAFEAVGYAKFTGRVGGCMATSGPGAIHLLNGLYDAKLDHVPVVAIVGQTSRSAMGGSYQQEVDLLSLFKDVASEYVQMVTVPEQLPGVLDRAIRVALAERAPTAIIIPSDVQELV